MPTRGEWSRFGLAIADNAASHEIGIVEHRSVGMHQRVAQLSSFVDGTRRLRCIMAGNASRKRKLPEQPPKAVFVLLNARVELRVRTFEIGVRHHARPAMPRTADVNDVEVIHLDDAIKVHVDEVQPWSRTPVSQQTRLDVLEFQRLTQQRIGVEVNLSDREIIRSAPVSIHLAQLFQGKGLCRRR